MGNYATDLQLEHDKSIVSFDYQVIAINTTVSLLVQSQNVMQLLTF